MGMDPAKSEKIDDAISPGQSAASWLHRRLCVGVADSIFVVWCGGGSATSDAH